MGLTDMLHEVVTDDGPRLEKLAREVQRIVLTLNELVASRPSNLSNEFIGFAAITTLLGDNAASVTAADVRNIIRLRRLRNQFFRPSLFGEPAWDMLLDLMAARLEGASVAGHPH